jgi:MFS family permease
MEVSIKKEKIGVGLIIAIMAPFICANFMLITVPALAAISAGYPDIAFNTITFVATIASLFGMVGGLISGALAGRVFKYKTVILTAIALVVVSGILPLFFRSFPILLISRICVGFGCGALVPLGYPLIFSLFKGDRASRFIGAGTSVMNIAGVGVQLLGGFISTLSLNFVWMSHLLALIFAVFVFFFLRENPLMRPPDEKVTASSSSVNKRMPAAVYFSAIGFGFLAMALYPIVLNISAIVVGEGLGDAAIAGTLSSLFFLGGILSGIFYPPLTKVFGRFMIPALCGFEVVGMLLGFFGRNLVLLGAGEVLVGVCHYMIWPAIVADFNTYVAPEKMSFASGILAGALNGFMFLTTPLLIVLANVTGNNSVRLPLLAGAIIIAIVMVVWFLAQLGRERKKTLA